MLIHSQGEILLRRVLASACFIRMFNILGVIERMTRKNDSEKLLTFLLSLHVNYCLSLLIAMVDMLPALLSNQNKVVERNVLFSMFL